MDERHYYAVEVTDGEACVAARIGPLEQRLGSTPVPGGPVVLGIRVEPEADDGAPDRVRLGFEADGEFVELAELDGRYLSTEVAGGFTGRVIGVYAADGTVHCEWMDYEARS